MSHWVVYITTPPVVSSVPVYFSAKSLVLEMYSIPNA